MNSGENLHEWSAFNLVLVQVYVGDMKGIQGFDADGRYLTLLNLKGMAFGMVFNDKNELFVIARDHVNKYAVQTQ